MIRGAFFIPLCASQYRNKEPTILENESGRLFCCPDWERNPCQEPATGPVRPLQVVRPHPQTKRLGGKNEDYDGNYNVEKKRMRAVLEREVSNGAVSYRLWRSDGKPDLEYPRAANDAYILHVEVNDHLVPLQMTDYALVNHCGLLPATIALYGSEEGRKEHFKLLRDSGAAGTGAFTEAMARETEKIIELGNDSARQADYIKSVLDQHVAAFLDSKECDGKSFPDFVGALILEEIPSCLALRTKYRAYKQEEALKRQAEQEEQDRAFCEERNRKAEQMIDLAVRTIRGGGTLKNEPISLYKSRYDSSTYSIVNHLMRRYQVDVPLRTQGWINDKLISVTIENGKCEHLRYMRSKGAQCSQKIFDCMHELILKVCSETEE